jgi:cell division transport system permease protein
MGSLLRLINGLSLIARLMVFLAALTIVIAIVLVCRAALAAQHETVALLHLMGASDADIARQFQTHARRLSVPAAVAGFGLAALTFAVLALLFSHFTAQPSAFSWLRPALMGLAAPVAAVAVATITARFSVLRLLWRMP